MKADGMTVIAGARQAALEAESHISLALGELALVRSELSRVEEENRDLRVEAVKREMRFYTEREFAAILKVSLSTIARLRRAARLEHLQVGNQIRYSSVHLEKAHEIFGQGSKPGSKRLKSFRN